MEGWLILFGVLLVIGDHSFIGILLILMGFGACEKVIVS